MMPPLEQSRLTLLTRPCISSGTARCRTVCEMVPHTKAWVPKKNCVTNATAGTVVSASTRW